MNLIEQLGGYENAKSIRENIPKAKSFISGKVLFADGFDKKHNKYVMCDGVYKFHYSNGWDIHSYAWHNYVLDVVDLNKISDALLQYRREHNIFEVGDKVVFTDDFMHDEIMTASDVNDAEIYMDDDSKRVILAMVRHATDAEIKANKREVG